VHYEEVMQTPEVLLSAIVRRTAQGFCVPHRETSSLLQLIQLRLMRKTIVCCNFLLPVVKSTLVRAPQKRRLGFRLNSFHQFFWRDTKQRAEGIEHVHCS
jgi:hypothetical protein